MKKLFILFVGVLFLTSCSKVTPVVILEPGNDNIEVYTENYEVAACTLKVKDQSYEMTIDDSSLDVNRVGHYTINYSYNYDDTLYECERMIFVNDTTAPNITLNKGIDTILLNSEWVDTSVSYSDNYSDTLTLTTTGSVDTTKTGSYDIIYTVTDEFGNSSSITRVVTVY